MKSILLMLLSLVSSFFSMAQVDENYKGPSKVEMKLFWRKADEFRNGKGNEAALGDMKRALENFKYKDHTYNTSSMETEFAKCQSEVDKKAYASMTPEEKAVKDKLDQLNYSGPASVQVQGFWGTLKNPGKRYTGEEERIKDMQYYIDKGKEKDPDLNTSEMEAELKKIKDDLKAKKLAEVRQTNGDKRSSRPVETVSNDPTTLLEKLFIENNISVGSTADLPQAPSKIEAYKSKLTKLLTMDYTDALIKKGRYAKGNINGFAAGTDRELDKIDGYLKDAREKTGMEYIYYTIQYHAAYWDAAQKIFPEENSYINMYKKVSAGITKLGNLEQLYAKAEANRIEYIKNTKLPAPVVKDANLEKILTNGFNKEFASRNVSALKAVLTQNGWTTLRNSLTGIVIGRERSAKLAYKGSDGKCYLLDDYIFIHEEYVGGSFINTKAVFNGLFSQEMLCENVK